MRASSLYVIEDTVRHRVGGVRFTVGVSTSRFGTRSVIRSYYDTSSMTAFFIRGMNQQKAHESNGEQSGRAKPRMPWFILFFVCASIVATYLPKGAGLYELLTFLAKIGLTVTMYLIGSSITLKTIRAVGFSTLLQGMILWIIIAGGALLLIDGGLITL